MVKVEDNKDSVAAISFYMTYGDRILLANVGIDAIEVSSHFLLSLHEYYGKKEQTSASQLLSV